MNKKTITVTRALAELSTLDNKIFSKIDDLKAVGIANANNNLMVKENLDKKEFIDREKFKYQSITDLIAMRNAYKKAIILSNATTVVRVGGNEMTVAEAIARKDSIECDEKLLRQLIQRSNIISLEYQEYQAKLEDRANTAMLNYLNSSTQKAQQISDTANKIYEDTMAMNKREIADSIDISQQIRKLQDSIMDFKTEVDFALSESNAKTEITIEW